MRKTIFISTAITFFLFSTVLFFSCKKEIKQSPQQQVQVDENGLTNDIKNLVPQWILDEMLEMGVPIYGGANPPKLEGTYLMGLLKLINSSVPGDKVGAVDGKATFRFYNQDNNKLIISQDFSVTNGETGYGKGSFIVGNDCQFSIFVEGSGEYNGYTAKSVFVISGEVVEDGIANMHMANVMIDDHGDPGNVFIANGQGRMNIDDDGISERTDASGTTFWFDRLPDCPCTYNEAQSLNKTQCPEGEWLTSAWWVNAFILSNYHYGASNEARWIPANPNGSGQQCTYDSKGMLITGGIAAGSPDFVSPGTTWDNVLSFKHTEADVEPWEEGGVSCETYLKSWPANKGKNCTGDNSINDISHLYSLIYNMSCEEVVLLFKAIDRSSDAILKGFIHNNPPQTPNDLKQRLVNLRQNTDCLSTNEGYDTCRVLTKLINNL